jgi:hypothetical protein
MDFIKYYVEKDLLSEAESGIIKKQSQRKWKKIVRNARGREHILGVSWSSRGAIACSEALHECMPVTKPVVSQPKITLLERSERTR